MRKLLTLLLLLVGVLSAWAGEKTITISRNDVAWESANTVYNVTKGGVELVMSGGMNNPNFLLMKQHTTITVKSHNFNIKRIVFHCLDNFTNDNLDPFYWGPTTLHIQYSQTHQEYAGTLTYNYQGSTYDALWRSTKSSNPGNYPNGLPAGYELMFENEGKPVRFASIDIVVEQEVGDMYELVTSTSEINTTDTYMLVGRATATTTTGYAMSVNTTGSSASDNILSTPVTLIDNGLRVKATDETQFIKLATGTGNSTYKYYIKAGTNYIRSQTTYQSNESYNHGFCLTKVANVPSLTSACFTKVTINSEDISTNWDYYADIRYQFSNPYTNNSYYALRHNNDNKQFRNLYNNNSRQRVFLYKPAKQYLVTTEVRPNVAYGSISLRDGILVDNGRNWSQKMDTVQFLVTPADGYKVKSLVIQEVTRDANDNVTQVLGTVDILNSSQSINGTLYNFVMPGNDVHIIAEFEEVVYHNVYIQVNPSGDYGNVFLTEGYVVQNDQVKSYEGENVVFNVTPNLIDIDDESKGYHELYSVTVTYNEGGQTISYTYTDGNYDFTMPDADVLITATFIYNNNNPLYLLGTANGGTWAPTGPRFNYDPQEDQYYIDVYFKGDSGDYGDYTGGNLPEVSYGHFNVVWGKWNTWAEVNSNGRRGIPYTWDYLISESNPNYGLVYDDTKADQGYAFKIPAGIYRIYVKSYGYHNDQLTIVKYPTTLTFDPAGGATAAEAVEVGKNQLVTLSGDVYDKIMAINPDEPAANFKYKAVKTIGENSTADTPVSSTTTATTTLDQVNEGTTVTQLDGYNYLGWIVANNTGYYKVIDTPLHWIEEYGEKDNTYTVSDRMQGIYAIGTSLWCKDLGDISIVKTSPVDENQIDFLWQNSYTRRPNSETWDQSNWVELDFSDYDNGATMASNGVDHYIAAGTVTGDYIDDVNYKIKVSSGELTLDGAASYEPNIYCPVNFLESNLVLKEGDQGAYSDTYNKYYYMLNPKVQEYAVVTWAMWDESQHIFVVPAQNSVDNTENFTGAFRIGDWGYNIQPGDEALEGLADEDNAANEYAFHMIVKRLNKEYGTPARTQAREGQTPSPNMTAWPIDLEVAPGSPSIITAVSDVRTAAQVQSVHYVNVAGMTSNRPWSGVNIVVTRYADGTTTATKVVR